MGDVAIPMSITPAMTRMGLGMPQWDLSNNFLRDQHPADGVSGPSFPPSQIDKLAELNQQHAKLLDDERQANRDRACCETEYDQLLVAKREAILHRDAAAVRVKEASKEYALREAERDACDQRLDQAQSVLLWCNNAENCAVWGHEESVAAAMTARFECASEFRQPEHMWSDRSEKLMAQLCTRFDHRATYSDAAMLYRMEDRRLRERDTLVCGQLLELATQRLANAESVLDDIEVKYEAADQKAQEATACAAQSAEKLNEARCTEDTCIKAQQQLREYSRGRGLAHGGLQGFAFPQVAQYNEYLRPLSRVHYCPEPAFSTMAV